MGVGSFGSHLEGTSLGTVGPCKGLTPVIPPSREEGVRFHRTSPSPLPPLGLHPHLILWLVGSHLPRGGLGHQAVSRDLTSRDISGGRALHLGDPQASPAGITGTFPAEETKATVASLSSGLGRSSRGDSSHSSWACQQVCELGTVSLPCRPHGTEPGLLGARWTAVICSSNSSCLGPAAAWRTRHSHPHDHEPTLLRLPWLVTNPIGWKMKSGVHGSSNWSPYSLLAVRCACNYSA